MVKEIRETENFKKIFNKLDKSYKERVKKLLTKIINNPKIGKPMKYARKGTRELYIKPFRLSYTYVNERDTIYFLDLYHKKKQ